MRTNAAEEKKKESEVEWEEEEEDQLRSQFQAQRCFGMSNVLYDECSCWKCYRLDEGIEKVHGGEADGAFSA